MRLRPERSSKHLGCLGAALGALGRSHEAKEVLDAATTAFRAEIRLKPDSPVLHNELGLAMSEQGKIDEAIAVYRTALMLKPNFPAAHTNLGRALATQGKLDEAIAEYREAVRLKSDYYQTYTHLGNALKNQGKRNEAIVEYREALRLKPRLDAAHYMLAKTLKELGKLEEAILEYRTAIRLKPDYAEAHINLGNVFSDQGHYAEALAEIKLGHELGSKKPTWHYPSGEWVRRAERIVRQEAMLPAILGGRAKSADALESLGFAEVCYGKKLHGAAARFWTEAFQAQPKLADDMKLKNRYNAACVAALAGSGAGKDEPPLDDKQKARWRTQAIDWLEADLATWSKVLENGAPQARQRNLQDAPALESRH